MKTVLVTLAAVVILAIIGGFVMMFGGFVNVAATNPEPAIVKWILNTTMEHSVSARAKEIQVPVLNEPASIKLGFELYKDMCVSCHGSPIGGRSEVGAGLNPPAPDLAEAAKEWNPAELYWITKNGIKMTGMPAFGVTHDDEELWAMVAFMGQLKDMTPEQYRLLVDLQQKMTEQGVELGSPPLPGTHSH